MSDNFFDNNDVLSNLSPEKLNFLMNFATCQKPTDMKQMAPFLLSSLNSAKKDNIQFTPSETELLIQILKQNMSPEEAQKADKLVKLMNQRRSG